MDGSMSFYFKRSNTRHLMKSQHTPYTHHLQHYQSFPIVSLQWRHVCNGVSNHQSLDCLLNSLLGRRDEKTSKLRVTGLCEGNSPISGGFPAQRAINAENVSIGWGHNVHANSILLLIYLYAMTSFPVTSGWSLALWGHWWRRLQPTSSIISDVKSHDSNRDDFAR